MEELLAVMMLRVSRIILRIDIERIATLWGDDTPHTCPPQGAKNWRLSSVSSPFQVILTDFCPISIRT